MDTSIMAIRGDTDIHALLHEFGVTLTSDTPHTVSTVDTHRPNATSPLLLLCPPSHPTVETIRHRIHETLKGHVYDAIRFCAPNEDEPYQQWSIKAKKNHYLRSVIGKVYKDMPPHHIWEKYQFSVKQLEADCVRENQIGQEVVWSSMQQKSCKDDTVESLLFPSVPQIYSWMVYGRSRGILWEPLLPVSSICIGKDNDASSKVNETYNRMSRQILENELQFHFRRSFKRCCMDKGSMKQSLDVNEIYATLVSLSHDATDNGVRDKHLQETTNEEFILQYLFESHPFQKIVQKLHKKLQYIYEDASSNFMKQLKKASDQIVQQSSSSSNNKRKKGKNKQPNMPKLSYEQDSNEYETQATVTFGGISLRINERHLKKLHTLYQSTLCRMGYKDKYEQYFTSALFTLLLRYDALEGPGLQSAIPPHVFRWIQMRYGCSLECFASPFNCWMEIQETNKLLGANYSSAFEDTDSFFHSAGSFFDIDFIARAKKEGGGCFQANPPFTSNFIELMCNRMNRLLGFSDNDADVPIMFIVFVPTWKESVGWKALERSPYMTKHILLLQKEDEHYYAEGTQHRRRVEQSKHKEKSEKHGSHRVASFDTSVFFLQNVAAQAKWQLSDDDKYKLKQAFAMKLYKDVGREPNSNHTQRKQVQQKNKSMNNKKVAKTVPKPKQSKPNKPNHNTVVSTKKKSKLLEGGKDEMNILASLGLVDSSPKKRELNPESSGNKQKKKFKHRLSR